MSLIKSKTDLAWSSCRRQGGDSGFAQRSACCFAGKQTNAGRNNHWRDYYRHKGSQAALSRHRFSP